MTHTEESSPELLACPFCKSKPQSCPQNSERPHPWNAGEWCVYIWCETCDARGPEKKSPEEAITAWNTRASISSTPATTDEVEPDVKRRLLSVAKTLETCGKHGVPIDFVLLASDIRAALNQPRSI